MPSKLLQISLQAMINNNNLRHIYQYGNEYEIIFLTLKDQHLYTTWIKKPDKTLLNYIINRSQFKVIESNLITEIKP
jgi:hypothetical protein